MSLVPSSLFTLGVSTPPSFLVVLIQIRRPSANEPVRDTPDMCTDVHNDTKKILREMARVPPYPVKGTTLRNRPLIFRLLYTACRPPVTKTLSTDVRCPPR